MRTGRRHHGAADFTGIYAVHEGEALTDLAPPPRHERPEIFERASQLGARAVWVVGTVVAGLIAVAAIVGFSTRLDRVWREWGVVDFAALAGGTVALTAVAGIVVLVYRLSRTERGSVVALGLGLGLVLLTRSAAVILIDAPLVSDWRVYHEMAAGVAAGDLGGDRPMGYPLVLGGLYFLFGAEPYVPETLNVLMDLVTAGFLYLLVRGTWNSAAAAVAVVAWAVSPAQILLMPVGASEPLYTALFVGGVTAATSAAHRSTQSHAAIAGVLLGLSQYVRATSLALLPAFLVLPLLVRVPIRQSLRMGLVTGVAFLLVLGPVAVGNAQRGRLSVSTSDWLGWQLYVGTNQTYNGIWNNDDLQRFEAFPGDTVAERSAVAARLGLQRITSDVPAFAALAVRKFRAMWGADDYSMYYSVILQEPPPKHHEIMALLVLTSAYWTALTVGTFIALVRERRRRPPLVLLAASCIAIVAVAHTFLEVQTRYHAYLTPLLCALAAAAILQIFGGQAQQRDDSWPQTP